MCDSMVLLMFGTGVRYLFLSRPLYRSESCLRRLGRLLQAIQAPVGVPLDLSKPTGMSCIGTYGENYESDNVSKYRVLLVAFLLLCHEN